MEENEATPASPSTAEAVPENETLAGAAPARSSFDLVSDLPVEVTVEIGRTQLLLREVLDLESGSVLQLDRGSDDPADVFVNGRLIARGDLTSVDDRIAVRIVELVGPAARSLDSTRSARSPDSAGDS